MAVGDTPGGTATRLPVRDESVLVDPGLPPAEGELADQTYAEGATNSGRNEIDPDLDAAVRARLEAGDEPAIQNPLGDDPLGAAMDAWLERNLPQFQGEGDRAGRHPLDRPETPEAPAPEGDALPPAAAAPAPAPAAPAAEEPEVPAKFGVEYGGQRYELTEDDGRELLGAYEAMNAMRDVLPVAQAIQTGDVVALRKDDYEALLELARRQSQPAPAPQPAPRPQLDPDQFMDPQLARLLIQQQETLDRLAAQAAPAPAAAPEPTLPSPVYRPPTPEERAFAAEQDRLAQLAVQVRGQYAQQFGLTDVEAARMVDVAIRSGDIQRLEQAARAERPWSPVDYAGVYAAAFNRALVTDPSLKARYDATLRSAPSPTAGPTSPAAPAVGNPSVAAKKARASSLASVPAAATPSTPIDVAQLTDREVEAGIAAEIRQLAG